MTSQPAPSTWTVARFLIGSHIPFVVLGWVLFTVAAGAILASIAIAGTVTGSVWDQVATQIPRWFALGLGVYALRSFLPLHIAHGRTRRAFMVQAIGFTAAITATMAVLIAIGYALEAAIYHAMDWPLTGSPHESFTAGGFGLVVAAFWAMFGVWMVAGIFIAAGFYRYELGGVPFIAIGLLLAWLVGIAVDPVAGGPSSLPLFVGDILDTGNVSVPSVVSLASLLVGLATTWLLVRDMPMRSNSA